MRSLLASEVAHPSDGNSIPCLGLPLHVRDAAVSEEQIQPPDVRPRRVLGVLGDPTRQLVESVVQTFPAGQVVEEPVQCGAAGRDLGTELVVESLSVSRSLLTAAHGRPGRQSSEGPLDTS